MRAAAANGLANIPFSPRDRVGDNVTRGLIDATSDSHFIVRYAAIVAMGCLSDDTFLHTLQDIATNVAAPALEAAAAIRALGEIVEPNHVSQQLLSIVTKRAADRDDFIRAAVARTLGRWIGVANVQLLLDKMKLDEVKYGQSVMVNTILDNVSKGHLD